MLKKKVLVISIPSVRRSMGCEPSSKVLIPKNRTGVIHIPTPTLTSVDKTEVRSGLTGSLFKGY